MKIKELRNRFGICGYHIECKKGNHGLGWYVRKLNEPNNQEKYYRFDREVENLLLQYENDRNIEFKNNGEYIIK